MRLLGMVLLAAALVAPVAARAAAPEDVAQARQLLDSWRGDPAPLHRAREILEPVLKKDSRNVEAMKEQARLVLMTGYISERTKRSGGRSYTLGEYAPGTLQRAEAILVEALRVRPDFAGGYVLLGNVYVEQEKPQAAEAALRKAEALGTTDPWLHLNWAGLHQLRGEKDASIERARRVIGEGKANAKALGTAYEYLIEHLREEGRHEEALALSRRELAREPTAWAHGNLANYLQSLGRYQEAIAEARKGLKIMDYGIGRGILARSLYSRWAELVSQGRRAAANPYFDEAYAMHPDLDGLMLKVAQHAVDQHLIRSLATEKKVSIDVRDKDGSTPLLIAVNNNNVAAVKFLLGMGADPNLGDRRGWTPLISAADEGNEQNVKALLAAGADRKATRKGRTADMQAEAKGHTKLAGEIREYAGGK